MADLTRERLAQLREQVRTRTQLSWEEIDALLSMASRCVSIPPVSRASDLWVSWSRDFGKVMVPRPIGADLHLVRESSFPIHQGADSYTVEQARWLASCLLAAAEEHDLREAALGGEGVK